MSYDDKSFMSRGFRVRHKYTRGRGPNICERCHVKRRRTTAGWEYYNPKTQPKPVDGSKAKPFWSSSNPPCVKWEEPEEESKPELFPAKAELSQADLNVLSFFFQFAGPWADRAAHGFVDPEVARHPNFVENWHKFADILQRLYKSTGVEEYWASLTPAKRRALGKKISAMMHERSEKT